MKFLGIQNKPTSQPGCGKLGRVVNKTKTNSGQSRTVRLTADSADNVDIAMWAGSRLDTAGHRTVQQSRAEGCLQTLITVSSHRIIHGATLEGSNCLFEV